MTVRFIYKSTVRLFENLPGSLHKITGIFKKIQLKCIWCILFSFIVFIYLHLYCILYTKLINISLTLVNIFGGVHISDGYNDDKEHYRPS